MEKDKVAEKMDFEEGGVNAFCAPKYEIKKGRRVGQRRFESVRVGENRVDGVLDKET